MRDNLAAARAVLKKHSMMLLTASKAYVRHPELAAAKENRDFVFRQVSAMQFLYIIQLGNDLVQLTTKSTKTRSTDSTRSMDKRATTSIYM